MLCSLLKETITTRISGSTQASAHRKKTMLRMVSALREIWLTENWCFFLFFLRIISMDGLLPSEQGAVRLNAADDQVGAYDQDKADKRLVQAGGCRHADVARLFQCAVNIGINDLRDR